MASPFENPTIIDPIAQEEYDETRGSERQRKFADFINEQLEEVKAPAIESEGFRFFPKGSITVNPAERIIEIRIPDEKRGIDGIHFSTGCKKM
jgi:hypothetical protein